MAPVGVLIRCALAAVLLAAAVLKLAAPASSRSALATFGIRRRPSQWAAWVFVVATEVGLAAAVAGGSTLASWLAAGLLGAFAVLLAAAIARGRTGAPCACFGSRSRVGWTGVARTAALAGGFAAAPLVPDGQPSVEAWLALGLGVAFAGLTALGLAVLALAREIGVLRLQLGPQSALEIPDEGPPLKSRTALIDRFELTPRTRFALAVFSSDGCGLCRRLEPAIAALGADPVVALETFDELLDGQVWAELGVPGSPYGVALDLDGVVRAKGVFNSFGQLESILAAAERRMPEGALV
ncbi:MAG: hypothetical protein M3R70_10270 [Actinomycetota bacterium]|nr:hypothetical protein [Actinomycetota bacterium]